MFYCGLMLLWVMGVGFDNTCAVSGKWNVSRAIPRLYGWVHQALRLSPLVVEHSVVTMGARLNPMVSQFSIPVLWNLYSESVGGTQLRTRHSDTDIVNFVSKSDEEEAESIVLLIFVLWWCLNRRWKGGGVG